eukprot:TsM_000853600 transcript=TsM_000853600 gene=TsM_000853600
MKVLKAAAAKSKRVAIAMEAVVTALRRLPAIIADNGELVPRVRTAHATGYFHVVLGVLNSFNFILIRLDMEHGCIANMEALGLTESFNVKRQSIIWAPSG